MTDATPDTTKKRRIPALYRLITLSLALYLLLEYAVTPPLPDKVIHLFMAISVFALVLYFSIDEVDLDGLRAPLFDLVTQRRLRPLLLAILLLAPLLVSWKIYRNHTTRLQPPVFGRTIHPAPPPILYFRGKKLTLHTTTNPLRQTQQSNPSQFKAHLIAGERLYFQNCVFCHGPDLRGKGIFAHALNPRPTDFRLGQTLSQLSESYLFWRIAKGAKGLPAESGPGDSSMPSWEDTFSERQIWQVILYLYKATGQKPRIEEAHP